MQRVTWLIVGAVTGLSAVAWSSAVAASPEGIGIRCEPVVSDGSITYTNDQGHTVAETTGVLRPGPSITSFSGGPGGWNVFAVNDSRQLFHSPEYGCEWHEQDRLPAGFTAPQLYHQGDSETFIWSRGSDRLAVIKAVYDEVELLPRVTGGNAEVVDLVVSRFGSDQVRVVLDDGRVMESIDRGETFAELGVRPPGVTVNDAAIDPDDFDHIVLGTAGDGVFLTTDAGSTWTHVDLGAPGEMVDVHDTKISLRDSANVYALGRNLAEASSGDPSEGRHVYRSRDGGASFRPVLDQTRELQLGERTVMALHPSRPGVIYLADGTDAAETELFRFADRRNQLTVAPFPDQEVTAIGFHLYGPRSMYLGLASN